jgi:tetratricopeptide (TPR) repeat protein
MKISFDRFSASQSFRLKFSQRLIVLVRLALLCGVSCAYFAAVDLRAAAENPPAPAPEPRHDDTNTLDLLRSSLQVQEQLHQLQLMIEQNRKEAEVAAARNSGALADRLQVLEESLAAQRSRELQAMHESNHAILTVAGTFATVGFLAMLLMAWFQWRAVHRLAEMAASLPRTFGPAALPAIGMGDSHVLSIGQSESNGGPLLGAIGRLEKRIDQLEHSKRPAIPQLAESPGNHSTPAAPTTTSASVQGPENGESQSGGSSRFALLLAKGKSLLNMDQPEEALACFEQALTLEPKNAEAELHKGLALERMRKMDDALACYDRAIAADSLLTVAYLHKGALYNRMERFSEALECYEEALRATTTGSAPASGAVQSHPI